MARLRPRCRVSGSRRQRRICYSSPCRSRSSPTSVTWKGRSAVVPEKREAGSLWRWSNSTSLQQLRMFLASGQAWIRNFTMKLFSWARIMTILASKAVWCFRERTTMPPGRRLSWKWPACSGPRASGRNGVSSLLPLPERSRDC